jgi:hypothetical protein
MRVYVQWRRPRDNEPESQSRVSEPHVSDERIAAYPLRWASRDMDPVTAWIWTRKWRQAGSGLWPAFRS